MPVHTYGWEGYHSKVNSYSSFMVPAPAISEFLNLTYQNHSPELYDSLGEKATSYLRRDHGNLHLSKLMYLRQDYWRSI